MTNARNMSIAPKCIEGTYTSLITPFLKNGEIDYQTLEHLVWDQIQAGISGLVLFDRISQGDQISLQEKLEVASSVVEYVNGEVPVIVSIKEKKSEDAIKMQHAFCDEIGASTFMHMLDDIEGQDQFSKYKYLEGVTSALPVKSNIFICNQHGNIMPGAIIDYSRWQEIVGVRLSIMDRGAYLEDFYRIVEGTNSSEFHVLGCNDFYSVGAIRMGAHGIMSDTANIAPQYFVKMINETLDQRSLGDYSGVQKAQEYINFLVEHCHESDICCLLAEIIGSEVLLPLTKRPVIHAKTAAIMEEYGPQSLGLDFREYHKRS